LERPLPSSSLSPSLPRAHDRQARRRRRRRRRKRRRRRRRRSRRRRRRRRGRRRGLCCWRREGGRGGISEGAGALQVCGGQKRPEEV